MSKQNHEQAKKVYERLKKTAKVYCLAKKFWLITCLRNWKIKNKKDKEFVTLIVFKKYIVPAKTAFAEQRSQMESSSLYNFDTLFQPLHADVVNSDILGRKAADPWYFLLFVNLLNRFIFWHQYKKKKNRFNFQNFYVQLKNPD